MIPTRLLGGRYIVLGQAGHAVLGPVWRAEDRLSGERLAIREMHLPGIAGEAERALFRERLLREARLIGRVGDPGLIAIRDVLAAPEADHVVTELLEGESLEHAVRTSGPLASAVVEEIIRRLLGTLAVAHRRGLVHGSIRPRSILLAGQRIALADAGIIPAADHPRLLPGFVPPDAVGYTAPERLRGGALTPATDLWGLGAALFFAIEGRGPFDRGKGTRAAVLDDVRRPLTCPDPAGELILALLTPDPARRPSAATALEQLPRRRRWPWSTRRKLL